MDDRPQDRAEDRRRRGPLGDEEEPEETTRRVPQARGEEDATRQLSPEDAEREAGAGRGPASEKTSHRVPGEEDPETRVIRAPGSPSGEATPYPSDYMEEAEAREARLREIYGGVDYLASFIGAVFALVCSGILLSLSALVLAPLGFTLDLLDQEINVIVIIGLLVIGVVLFVAYFCGGYVAGRLARFDGGRNGVATVAWGILLSAILLLFGSLLPGGLFEFLQEFVQNNVLPTIGHLTQIGAAGAAIVVGALLLELLGGFLGGRLGNSYHTEIDHTT